MAGNRISYISERITTPKVILGVPLNTATLTSLPNTLSSIDLTYNINTRLLTAENQIVTNDLFTNSVYLSDVIEMPPINGVFINDFSIIGDLNIFGRLSALSALDSVYTSYTPSCALSVLNLDNVTSLTNPTFYVGQTQLGQPVIDVKANAVNSFFVAAGGNIGIKTYTPNEELTVQGDISASETIFTPFGNSDQWNELTSLIQGTSGSFGAQGTQGTSGSFNFQGIQGTLSMQGTVGIPHYQGVQGLSGVQGTFGRVGTVGTPGAQGATGIQGLQGVQGIISTDGAIGIKGSQGIQGLQGTQSTQGTQGTAGYTSDQGVQGAIGRQGQQGIQGSISLQGLLGTDAIQGAQGGYGQSGIDAAQGPQGIQGMQSAQGNYGLQNFQGLQGIANTQNIQGMQGRVGTQGSQGTQGPQGISPSQGLQGAQGLQNDQGNQGNQGLLGTTEAGGTQGTFGRPGAAGATLIEGDQGVQGAQAVTDLQGIQGGQGISTGIGRQGTQALRGESGIQNIQGAQGIDTETGRQGTRGLQGLNLIYISPVTGLLETLLQGTQGLLGYIAPPKNNGPIGLQGATEAQGIQGPGEFEATQGRLGTLGPRGGRGEQGGQGISGPRGVRGERGPQGVQGITNPFPGAQGPVGAPGGLVNSVDFTSIVENPIDTTTYYGLMRESTNNANNSYSVFYNTGNRYRINLINNNNAPIAQTRFAEVRAAEGFTLAGGQLNTQVIPGHLDYLGKVETGASGSNTINLLNGTYFIQNIGSTTTFILQNAAPANLLCSIFSIQLNYTVTNPAIGVNFSFANLKWEGNVAPEPTRVSGRTDIYTFIVFRTNNIITTYGFQNIKDALTS